MKKNRINPDIKIAFLGIFLLMFMLPISSKAQKIRFEQSSIVPAAEGYVKVKSDRNKNKTIKIRIKNLAEIERVDPDMKTYIVWMVTDRETIKNIGQIKSTNKLNISFNAVSSFQPIRFFITSEMNESTLEPGNKMVLTTENFYK
jgi:hypothetical protein